MAISQQFNTWSKNHLMTCSKSSKRFRKIQKLWSQRIWCWVRSRLHVTMSRDRFWNMFFIFNNQLISTDKCQKSKKSLVLMIFFLIIKILTFLDILKYWHRWNLLTFLVSNPIENISKFSDISKKYDDFLS